MRRSSIASLLLLPATVWAVEVASQTPAETPAREENAAAESPLKSEPGNTKPKRELSPETAAKLAAAAPKFVPPVVVTPGTAEATEASPVLRETDKPRNQIIRLPRYIVEEQKLHVPRDELQVLTPKGRVDYAFKRRPGLRMVPFAWLNAGVAVEMLEDDLRAQRRAEEADLWSLYLIRDPAPATKQP